jgi:uncharacterized repeat protein (TIGR01451 family)
MWFSSVPCRSASARPRKFRPVLEALEARLAPAVFRVTSLADSNVTGSGSLRRAITDSNAKAGPNEIDILTPGPYALTLNGTATDNSAGELALLNNDVTILNKSGGPVVIDAGGLATPDRVFEISPTGPPVNVTITGVTIQGGNTEADGGGIRVGSTSTLTLNNDVVQHNQAGSGGGGISTRDGPVKLNDTLVANNSGSGLGGGILQDGAATLTISDSLLLHNLSPNGGVGGGFGTNGTGPVTISDCEFSDNFAAGSGGGLFDSDRGSLTIVRSTFNDNSAGGAGGGLDFETTGDASLSDLTVSGNSAVSDGGGIASFGTDTILLVNCTIVNNHTGQKGGGIFTNGVGGSVQLKDTIVAKNTTGLSDPDVFNGAKASTLVDEGSNFIGDNEGAEDSFLAGPPNTSGSYVGTDAAPLDPLLEGLADNGGTVVLPDGSHLLTQQDEANNGNNGVRGHGNGAGAPPTDERGFPLPVGAPIDIGAFQFQDFDVAVSTSAPAGTVRAGKPAAFTLTVTNKGPNTSRGVTLTATLPAGTAVVGASTGFTVSGNVVTFAVPDLAAGASASFTLTVVPAAPGPFTETAVVSTHDDTNPANNTASARVTVQPAAFPPTGFADVTGLLQVVPQGRRRRPQRQLFFLLANDSTTPLQGPLGVVVLGLRPRRGPKLLDATGTTAGGQKFVGVNVGGDDIFNPGQSALAELVFSQPFKVPGLDVLAGAFA